MRVLVVSDIHGNIEALRAVVAAEPGVDQVLCLGDSVDYGPSPDEVVSWVRHHASAAVRGNHDNAVAFDEDCRSAPLFRRLSVESRKRTVSLLSADNLTFLRSLPARKSVLVDGRRLELLHAAPGDPLFQYLPATRVEEWRSAAAEIDADLVLVGHTHLPVILDLGEKRVVNPGSVGLPRDGDPRACYAIIDSGSPVLRRVGYDVDRTIAALRAWGLPEDVTLSLESLYRGGDPVSPFTGAPA
ncbi:MAG TPA: YfcE family phosphodiesterase [Thermoanaerobaculaceae bacterium]|nr:YfcE family phosphodiesterase [Thermoanaerobaculaceae bacterium]